MEWQPSSPSSKADPMTDVARIAMGLSAQQHTAIGHLAEIGKPWRMPVRWSVLVGYGLERLGLAKRTFWTDKTRLTPLGIAVANHLKGIEQ